jgi:F0F1-type ATP synthase assembly protein I
MSDEPAPDESEEEKERYHQVVRDLPGLAGFVTMGSTIAGCEAVGVLLGIWADRTWGTAPAGLLIGIVLGTVAAVVSVVQQIRRFL